MALNAQQLPPGSRQMTILMNNLNCPSCVVNIQGTLSALDWPLSISTSIMLHKIKIIHPNMPSNSPIAPSLADAAIEIDSVLPPNDSKDPELDESLHRSPRKWIYTNCISSTRPSGGSYGMHRQQQWQITSRLILAVLSATPTFIIGVVYMSLVSKDKPGRRYLEEPMWSRQATKIEWALLFTSMLVYLFAGRLPSPDGHGVQGIVATW